LVQLFVQGLASPLPLVAAGGGGFFILGRRLVDGFQRLAAGHDLCAPVDY
jgi:hypothetical protein